jgi:hypothetical protein
VKQSRGFGEDVGENNQSEQSRGHDCYNVATISVDDGAGDYSSTLS